LGRTGKMFAFEHGDVTPTSSPWPRASRASYLPLGAVGVSRQDRRHFRKNVFWGGLTYNSHPLGLATAEAVIDVMRTRA
jgi:taurine--2-oxoglutarate transaminase